MTEFNAASSATGTTSTCIRALAFDVFGTARLPNIAPAELMLVAAHPDDLRAARRQGLATAYVKRSFEFGPGKPLPHIEDGEFDFVASEFNDLATQLSA